MCEHQHICTDYNTNICIKCGLEEKTPIETSVKMYTLNQPLWIGYSRVNRFRKILKTLFFPRECGKISGDVFLKMKAHGKFENVENMRNYLKTLTAKSKNYNAMHLYAIYFVKNYVNLEPPLLNMRDNLIADFSLLETGMTHMFPLKRFFSYRWVLIKLLKKYELWMYVPFVKPLVNKNSSKKYEYMFHNIMTVNTPEQAPESPQVIERPLVQLQDGDS